LRDSPNGSSGKAKHTGIGQDRFQDWHVQDRVIQELQAFPDHVREEVGLGCNGIRCDPVKEHCVLEDSLVGRKVRFGPYTAKLPRFGKAD